MRTRRHNDTTLQSALADTHTTVGENVLSKSSSAASVADGVQFACASRAVLSEDEEEEVRALGECTGRFRRKSLTNVAADVRDAQRLPPEMPVVS